MATHRRIHRAVVNASRTANTAQHLLELRTKHVAAPVVEQYDVKIRRPGGIFGASRPMYQRRVIAEPLADCGPGQQAKQQTNILQCRHDFLDTGYDNVSVGQTRG